MKKLLFIAALVGTMAAQAETTSRPPRNKRHRAPKCGSRDVYRQGKSQVVKVVGLFVLSCVAAGLYMEKTSQY